MNSSSITRGHIAIIETRKYVVLFYYLYLWNLSNAPNNVHNQSCVVMLSDYKQHGRLLGPYIDEINKLKTRIKMGSAVIFCWHRVMNF